MRVLDRLDDTAAQVMSDLGETLVQNRLAVALLGDLTRFTGPARSTYYRWFADPAWRGRYPEDDHENASRAVVAQLRAALVRGGPDPRAMALVWQLRAESAEFAELWDRHEVALWRGDQMRIVQPELGVVELDCQVLVADNHAQLLLVFTASPGTEGYEKLRLLSVIGSQQLHA